MIWAFAIGCLLIALGITMLASKRASDLLVRWTWRDLRVRRPVPQELLDANPGAIMFSRLVIGGGLVVMGLVFTLSTVAAR